MLGLFNYNNNYSDQARQRKGQGTQNFGPRYAHRALGKQQGQASEPGASESYARGIRKLCQGHQKATPGASESYAKAPTRDSVPASWPHAVCPGCLGATCGLASSVIVPCIEVASSVYFAVHVQGFAQRLGCCGWHHGWAIALNCWGRHLVNRSNNSELFYVRGRDCPSMVGTVSWLCLLLVCLRPRATYGNSAYTCSLFHSGDRALDIQTPVLVVISELS